MIYDKKYVKKTLQNVSNEWILDYVNSIKTSQYRSEISDFRLLIDDWVPDFHEKTYIWPPYWIRHLKLKSEFTTFFSDLKNPNRSKKVQNLLNVEYVTPYWIHHFLFFKSDFRIVITNRRNSRVRVFKSITAKESRIYWNILCEIAILDLPFWILKFWLEIRNLWSHKPWNWSEKISAQGSWWTWILELILWVFYPAHLRIV